MAIKAPESNGQVYDQNDEEFEARIKSKKKTKSSSPSAEELERIPTLSDEEASSRKASLAGGTEEDDPVDDEAGEEKSLADQEADEAISEIKDDDDLSLVEKEALVHFDKVGRGYIDKPRNLGFMRRRLGKRNRVFLIGGSVTGALVIALVIFFSLLPFKILHIVNNLQDHFFASSNVAVQKETNVLFSNYMRKYVMPAKVAAKQCRSNIDSSCNPIQGNSLVAQLYKGWRHARLEDRLKETYGVEIKYNNLSKRFYLYTRDMGSDDGVDLGTADSGFIKSNESLDDYINNTADDTQFKQVSRKQLRAGLNDAISRETSNKSVLFRYKVGRFMETKYGLKRCVIFCDQRDNLADWKDNKTRAGKMIIAERVLVPRSEMLGLVVQCILSDDCHPERNSETDADGRKQSQIQLDLQTKLAELRALNDGRYETVLKHSDAILKDGYSNYAFKQVAGALVTKAGAGDATKIATEKAAGNFLPIVGWVNSSASTIGTLEKAPEKIQAMNFLLNGTAMAGLFGAYRVYADECKTGHCDAEMAGSMTDALNAGNQASVGGTATAEQSPLYGHLIDNDPGTASTALSNIVGQASAAGNDPAYTCKNHKPPDPGEWVCDEEVLGGNNSAVVKLLNDILGILGPLRNLADFWNASVGAVAKKAIGLFSYITSPVVSTVLDATHLNDLITGAVGPLMNAFTGLLIQDPFSDNMSGGRTFDLMAGGADVAGQGFAQNSLGARKITAIQAAAIRDEQTQQDYLAYKNQPLVSRIFDKNSNYSLTTKLAMAVPDNTKTASSNLTTALLSNPFSEIANLFSPMSGANRAKAAVPVNDPFGVPQYGYPSDDPALKEANKDPEAYWENNCSTDGINLDWSKPVNANWQNNTTTDPDNGLPEYDTTNPCLLIQAAVGAAGAKYDDSLLTKDDLTDAPAVGAPSEPSVSNANIYVLGNSLSEGMRDSGGLETKLSDAGWQDVMISASCGRSISSGTYQSCDSGNPVADEAFDQINEPADEASITNAGAIVIELGTNNAGSTAESFRASVTSLLVKLQKLNNSNAQIYWVNMYSKDSNGPKYLQLNKILSDLSTSLNFTVIDWASVAPAYYSNGQLHPSEHYNEMASYVVNAMGRPTVSGNGVVASGNAQQLAKQILNNSKITRSGRLVTEDLQATAAGKAGSSGAIVSTAILKLLATLGLSHGYDISAIESGGTGHTDGSQHYTGDAVDIDIMDGVALTGRDAGSAQIIKLATGILPTGSGFGQSGCGPQVTLPPGFNQFEDTCNHLHIQVPDGTP